jgi:aspartate/methionine/tyrosine aminotransferase
MKPGFAGESAFVNKPIVSESDLSKGLAFFWKKDYTDKGLETHPLIQRFVSNRTKALYYNHQALGNYFTYRHAIPILGLDATRIFKDGQLLLPDHYVDFGYMWSQAGAPESALKALRDNIREEVVSPYPPDLLTPLRDAAATIKFGRPRSAEFDVLGSEGAQGGIGFTFLAHLEAGDEVLITDPGYMHFFPGPNVEGAIVNAIPLRPENNFRLDPDEVRSRINNRTKMLVLCDPVNPFGTVQTKDELIEIANICRRNNVMIFNNVTHGTHQTDPNAIHYPLSSLYQEVDTDHVVSTTGISKGYALASLRLGFIAGHPIMLKGAALLRMEVTKIHINALSQHAALAALNDHKYVETSTAIMRRNLALVKKAISNAEGVKLATEPKYGFCTVLDVSETGVTAQELTVALFKEGFCVIPGDAMGEIGATKYIRLNYSQKDPEKLERFAASFADIVRDAQRGEYANGVKAFFRKVGTARGQRIVEEIEARQGRPL